MIAEAVKFERIMASRGAGAFSEMEYNREGHVILRTTDVRTSDVGGAVRVYFDSRREQVITGRRFDPMSSNLVLLRPGVFYRVQSQIEITEPLPKGVSAQVVLDPEIAEVMLITSGPMREGYVGPVYFTVSPFRKLEAEKMTSFGHLMFFEETEAVTGTLEVSELAPDPALEAMEKRLEAFGRVLSHLLDGKLPLQDGDRETLESNRQENESKDSPRPAGSSKRGNRISRGGNDAAGSSSEQSGPSQN